ncbi:MAG: M20/M25/M40 family metallo-hydrolase [bacterium]|nr:M20/M25/M40 family metallo-hydrolase [bacterium]
MKRIRTTLSLLLLVVTVTPSLAFAQAATAGDINDRIRKEGMDNSHIMKTLHTLTDVYGPRLTGSPKLKAAGDWATSQMKTWGFDRVDMEPWEWGNVGWANERAAGYITAPVKDNLTFEVLAWTPSTSGAVTGEAFQMILPQRPTQAELDAYFNTVRSQINGKIVIWGNPAIIPVNFESPAKRIADDVIARRFDPNPTASPGPQGPPRQFQPQPQEPKPGALSGADVNTQVNAFLIASGVKVRVNDAGREHGQIRAFSNGYDPTKVVPTVVLRNEDFGRIARLMKDGIKVELEFDIRNQIYPEGKTSYNAIGEIAGTDKADEVIMLGGHLDSWHAATGATDNAIGCAVMMEAARILKAIGVKPRRTIRVALWSGEEQGLLGSQAYVKTHFGSAEAPLPAYSKFGGYFNIDSGTGRARGFGVFGPPEAAGQLRAATGNSFAEYGFGGASASASRGLGGSDHTSFNQAGLPGIGVQQDPIEYGSHTWHTNLDTYERVVEDDVKKSAVIIAAAVYQLAMADNLLPRFAADKMPALPNRN